MSKSSRRLEDGNLHQTRLKDDDRRARWTMKYFFGVLKEEDAPFEVGNVAFDEQRYQVRSRIGEDGTCRAAYGMRST